MECTERRYNSELRVEFRQNFKAFGSHFGVWGGLLEVGIGVSEVGWMGT